MNTESTRLTSIDSLRGIASLAVCWFHMTNTFGDNSYTRVSGQYGWLGVEVFFVLSGFIIPYAMFIGGYTFTTGWKTFIGKRILRIEPPYLAAILLVFALWYASAMAPGFKGTPPPAFFSAQTALHIGYLTGIAGYPWLNVVFWTLAIEFQFYLLVSFLFGWLRNENYSVLIFADLTLMVVSLLLSSELFVFKYLGLFMLGIVAFQYRAGLIDKQKAALLLIAATIFSGLGLGWLIAAVGLLAGTMIVTNLDVGKYKIALWLGSISYSLYLVHVPVGGRIVNFGRRYVDSQIGELLLSVGALLVSLVAAYVFYLAIERPSQRLAARLRYVRLAGVA